MLDLRKIRDNPDLYRERLARRHTGDDQLIGNILSLDEVIRKLKQEGEALKGERNRASKDIGAIKAKGGDITEPSAKVKSVGDQITKIDQELVGKETEIIDILLRIPNINHESVPIGTTAADNRIERVIGQPAHFDFKPKPHWEIGANLGLIDLDAATKISGSGFIVFKGAGARLERALIGTSQLPKFAEDMYRVDEEPPLYLVPTAEVPVTNLHREEIVAVDRLPIRYAAYTPCFRREAGSAGKDTRGMIRVHQFDKVELVHIVTPEESYATLEVLVGHAEKVLQELGLHYRVVSLCTGDIGFGAAKCYDIEVWAPGVGAWLEVSSCSNFEDFQARRMNLRYKNSEGKNIFCHTLNGSGVALPRLFVALLETYQQDDGHVLIPAPLRPYLGGLSHL
jgi:seryl-tRNA synthetase